MEITSTSLFHFEWAVDQHGYEFDDENPLGIQVLRRKGGPLRAYRPIEEFPGMFRRFASLELTSESIVGFANQFGFLNTTDNIKEPIAQWAAQVGALRGALQYLADGDRDSVARIFNGDTVPGVLTHSIEKSRAPEMNVRIECDEHSKFHLRLEPRSLLGVMWFQLAGEVTEGTKFKKCKNCPEWFPVGPMPRDMPGGGTKRKQYCSPKCRVAAKRMRDKEEAQ